MPAGNERLAYVEGRVDEHSSQLSAVNGAIAGFRTEMAGLRADFDKLRTELRDEMDALRSELRGEMDALRSELRGEMDALRSELRGEMTALRTEVRSDFRWLVGLQVLTLLGVIGGMASLYYRG